MNYKEKAVEIFTKHFLREKNLPYEDRKIKAKKESIKYIQSRIAKLKEPEDHIYWEYLQTYVNRIDLTYNKQNEKLNDNCQEEEVYQLR